MKTKFTGFALAGVLVVLLVGPAMAQQPCQTRASAVDELAQRHQERTLGIGLIQGAVIELLVSKDGETWTLIITSSNGCVNFIGAGMYWQQVVPTYKPKGRGL